MAEPITWRNLSNVSLPDAVRPLQVAESTLTRGLDRAAAIIGQQEALRQAAVNRGEDAQILAFREALAGITDPAQLAARRAQLDAMRSTMGTRGRTAVLGAEEQRATALFDHLTKQASFDEAQRLRAEAPQVAQAEALMLNDNFDGAREIISKLSPQSQASVLAKMDARHRSLVERAREDLRFGNEAGRWSLEMDKLRASIDQAKAQTSAANASRLLSDQQRHLSTLSAQQNTINNLMDRITTADKGVIGSPEGMKAFQESIAKTISNPTQRENITTLIAQVLQENPQLAALPVETVETVALSRLKDISNGGFWSGVLTPSNRAMKTLFQRDLETQFGANADRIAANQLARAAAVEDLGRARLQAQASSDRAFPELARMRTATPAPAPAAPAPAEAIAPAPASRSVAPPPPSSTPARSRDSGLPESVEAIGQKLDQARKALFEAQRQSGGGLRQPEKREERLKNIKAAQANVDRLEKEYERELAKANVDTSPAIILLNYRKLGGNNLNLP